MSEPNYQLAEFPAEEGTLVLSAIDKVLAEHSAQLAVRPIINADGTLGAVAQVLKKVELVPKGQAGATENGTNSSDKTEETDVPEKVD